jgi:hypothetical protein
LTHSCRALSAAIDLVRQWSTSTKVRKLAKLPTFLLLSVWPGLAEAADALRLRSEPPTFSESYIQVTQGSLTPQLASSVRGVAGIQFGYGRGPFLIDDVKIKLPTTSNSKSYCVRIASDDGRYTALNQYVPGPQAEEFGAIETRSSYAHQLQATYRATEVVVRVVAAAACEGEAIAPLVPVVPPGAAEGGDLVVFVNAPGDLVDVRLTDRTSTELAEADCRSDARGAAVAYTEVCEIRSTEAMAKAARKLIIKMFGSKKTLVYPVLLK